MTREEAIDEIRGYIVNEVYNEKRHKAMQMAISALEAQESAIQKQCKNCKLWEGGEINIACPWGSNYEHYEDDCCSLWEEIP